MAKEEAEKTPVKKTTSKAKKQKSSASVVLIVLLSPIWLPLLIALASVVLSLIIAVFAIVVSFAVSGAAVILAGIVYLPISIITFIQNAPVGVGVLGSGLLGIGVGILLVKGAVALAKVSFKGMTLLVEKITFRKEQR